MPATKTEQTTGSLEISTVSVPAQKSTRPKVKSKRSRAAEGPKPALPASSRKLPPSARLVVEVRSGLGVTRALFARMTGFSVRAITTWETGRPLSRDALLRVMEMKRLRDALADRMRVGFIPKWLGNPCEGLGGLKPVEILERGENDRLWRTVLLIGSGMPT